MTDYNLVNELEEQAAKTEALTNDCAEYLFAKFDWETRTAEVEEMLSNNHEILTKAHRRFMEGYSLDLRLLFDKAAMDLCEASAKKLVGRYGEGWLSQLEQPSYE